MPYSPPSGGGGVSGVTSVNGQIGVVELSPSDIDPSIVLSVNGVPGPSVILSFVESVNGKSGPDIELSPSDIGSPTDSDFLDLSDLVETKITNPDLLFWVGTPDYPTIQSAVTAAELLPQADPLPDASVPSGITVFIPEGVYGEQVSITKNINIFGAGGWSTVIDSLFIKPHDAIICPKNISITGIQTPGGTTLVNETATGSGIFNPEVGAWEIRFTDCLIFGLNCTNINAIGLQSTKTFDDCTITNCANINSLNSSNDSNFIYTIDDTLPNLPTALQEGFNGIISDHNSFNEVSLVTGDGSTLKAVHTSLQDIMFQLNGGPNTQVYYMGTSVQNLSDGGIEFLYWQSKQVYTPVNSPDWDDPQPIDVDSALDQLASRVRALE